MYTNEFQYVLVRYMFNELGDEAANVGLIAVTKDPPHLITKTLEKPEAKSRADSRIDRDVVTRFMAYADSVTKRVQEATNENPLADRVFEQLREISGGRIRLSDPRSVLTDDVDQEVVCLYHRLVSPPSSTAEALPTTQEAERRPRDPLGGLRRNATVELIKAFRSGYGQLSKDHFARSYPVSGEKHKSVFDLAMISAEPRRRRREHLFHHVLVLPDVQESFNQAAGLCLRWSDVQAVSHVDRQLTAVLYSRSGAARTAGAMEATRLLKENEIEVVPMKEVQSLAKRLAQQPALLGDSHQKAHTKG